MEIIRIKADIHPDGDIYVLCKDKTYKRVGCISEGDFGKIPNDYYIKIKKIAKTIK